MTLTDALTPPVPSITTPTRVGPGWVHAGLACLCMLVALVGYDRFVRVAPLPTPAPVPPIPMPPNPGPTPQPPAPIADPVRDTARRYRDALAAAYAARVNPDGTARAATIREGVLETQLEVTIAHDRFAAAFDQALRATADATGHYTDRAAAGRVWTQAVEGLK